MVTTKAPETLSKPVGIEILTRETVMDVQGDGVAEGVNVGGIKRRREEEEADGDHNGNDVTNKSKLDTSALKQERLEKGVNQEEKEKTLGSVPEQAKVTVGFKSFESSLVMFDYFYKFLHGWAPNLDVNKYEHMMLLELLKKGHPEPDKKIGPGVRAFQVRIHPYFKSRCFFIVRVDGSEDDFSFRKCVNQIFPLSETAQIKHKASKALPQGRGDGGGGKRGGRGRSHRGRDGRPRN